VLLASWPAYLTTHIAANGFADVVTSATPLSTGAPALNLLLGNVPGAIGETSKIAILVGLAYLLITKTIWALQTFDLVYIMTKGGPMALTEFIAFYIQKTSFKFLKFGYGSAMSYTVSMICFALTFVYIKVFMGDDEQEKKISWRKRRKEKHVL
jgi:Na+-transporting NADH:ubiquinone oxidoreductase subunit NqrB